MIGLLLWSEIERLELMGNDKLNNRILGILLIILSVPMSASIGILMIFLLFGWIFPPGGLSWLTTDNIVYFVTSLVATSIAAFSINEGWKGNVKGYFWGYVTAVIYNLLLFNGVIPFFGNN